VVSYLTRLPILHDGSSKFQSLSDILHHAISVHGKELSDAKSLIDGKLVNYSTLQFYFIFSLLICSYYFVISHNRSKNNLVFSIVLSSKVVNSLVVNCSVFSSYDMCLYCDTMDFWTEYCMLVLLSDLVWIFNKSNILTSIYASEILQTVDSVGLRLHCNYWSC
jgi:hypothetical protein